MKTVCFCSLIILILVMVSMAVDAEWVKGDMHVHTRFSKWDGAYLFGLQEGPSVAEQVKAAKARGLKWIIFTEHEEMLWAEDSNLLHFDAEKGKVKWLEEKRIAQDLEAQENILVIVGEEVGSVIPALSDGHLLAYNINDYVYQGVYLPARDYQQIMIDLVKAREPEIDDLSPLTFIAHPKGRALDPDFPWEDGMKSVYGFTGFEVLNNGQVRVDEKEWDDLLMQGRKIVAIGNSDAHWDGRKGHEDEYPGKSFTWLNIDGPLTHKAVYQALKEGRAVASSRPWLIFSVNSNGIGETAVVSGTARIKISWDAEDSVMHQIDLIYNGQVIQKFGGRRLPNVFINGDLVPLAIRQSSPLVVNLVLPESGYLRVRAKSVNLDKNLKWYYAYTNPIWIEAVQPKIALLQPQVLFLNFSASIKDASTGGYQNIADLAREYGYQTEEKNWQTGLDLGAYDLIFFTGQSKEEVDPLIFMEYVKKGGTLVLLGELGPWNQRARDVLNQISQPLGIHFNADVLCDPTDHYGWWWNADPAIPRLRNFTVQNWLSKGLESLWVVWGSSLSVDPPALVIARGDEDSWGDLNAEYNQQTKRLSVVQDANEMSSALPFTALANEGQGRIIALGDTSLWINDWFNQASNDQLARNIFEDTLQKVSQRKQALALDKAGLDVVFVVDHSGSMAEPINPTLSLEKFALAQEAMREFSVFLEQGDCVSLVGFNESAEIGMELQYYHSFLLEKGIEKIPLPDGATNISRALELAYQQIARSISGNHSKLIILLTDGDYNRGINPLQVIQSAWPVYTIGLGSGDSFNESLLKEIAHRTGGEYKHAGSAQELGDFYASLALEARGASTVLRWRDYINQDQIIEHRVKLDEEAEKINFILNWGGSRLDFEVLGPQQPRLKQGANYIIYQVDHAPAGVWRLKIKGREIPQAGEQYLLNTTLQSKIQTNLAPFKSSYVLGEPIQIRLKLSAPAEEVLVQIQRPDGATDQLALKEEAEGLLTNQYLRTNLLGAYLIKVKIHYVQFEREIEELVMVGAIDQVFVNQASLLPQPNALLQDSRPLVQVRLSGPAGKIKEENLRLKLDNQAVAYQYDPVNQLVSYQPQKHLIDGEHRAVFSLEVLKVEWSFVIDTQAEIKSVELERQLVEAGEEAIVLLKAEPQGEAELEIKGVISRLSFTEIKPGIYRAAFQPQADLKKEAEVCVSFKDQAGNQALDCSQKIRIDTFPQPKEFALLQNYPNPFKQGTWIPFQLAQKSKIKIRIFNQKGHLVQILDLGEKEAGYYLEKDQAVYWPADNLQGEKLATGIYFYELKGVIKKMVKIE